MNDACNGAQFQFSVLVNTTKICLCAEILNGEDCSHDIVCNISQQANEYMCKIEQQSSEPVVNFNNINRTSHQCIVNSCDIGGNSNIILSIAIVITIILVIVVLIVVAGIFIIYSYRLRKRIKK